MSTIVITGQPCSGKSTYISNELKTHKDTKHKNPSYHNKIYHFFSGIKYLGIFRAKQLLIWSFHEKASFVFRLNLFRSAVSKFGGLNRSALDGHHFLIDEGIAHLPFLFLKTNTEKVVSLILNELKEANVIFLQTPGLNTIQERLRKRGHKRLKFLSLADFAKKNEEIENTLIHLYPSLCKEFEII